MDEIAGKIGEKGSYIWLLIQRLLDASGRCGVAVQLEATSGVKFHEIVEELGGDLGDLDGDGSNRDDGMEDLARREKRTHTRKGALMYIVNFIFYPKISALKSILQKSIVIISILMQSTNKSCNYLQSILGIFFHSTNTPEKVIETLAHAGLSISLLSMQSNPFQKRLTNKFEE